MSSLLDDTNPYAPVLPHAPAMQGDEEVRRQHLALEESVKSVGILFLIGGILGGVLAGLYLFIGIKEIIHSSAESSELGFAIFISAFILGTIAALQFATGLGLRRRKPWSRIVAIVFSVIGLIAIPLGTIVSAYVLYLLLCKKGRFVFSAEYGHVISETPHLRYRSSVIVWVVICLLAALLVTGFLLTFRVSV